MFHNFLQTEPKGKAKCKHDDCEGVHGSRAKKCPNCKRLTAYGERLRAEKGEIDELRREIMELKRQLKEQQNSLGLSRTNSLEPIPDSQEDVTSILHDMDIMNEMSSISAGDLFSTATSRVGALVMKLGAMQPSALMNYLDDIDKIPTV